MGIFPKEEIKRHLSTFFFNLPKMWNTVEISDYWPYNYLPFYV